MLQSISIHPLSAVFARRNIRLCGLLAVTATLACGGEARSSSRVVAEASSTDLPERVRVGAEVLVRDSLHLVAGRRVGLITNHTGTVPAPSDGAPPISTIDLIAEAPDVELVALFGPEHGLRGDAEAGEHIDDAIDERTGVPIHSLYGATRRPAPETLRELDVLLFDMQDVGARYYTYVSTMAYAMEAAGAAGIPFVVLDRPNPIGGDAVQGNVLDPAFATFVGLYPVPMRHGMTVGELARLYVAEFGVSVELHVVPMHGWRREMTFEETGLPWVAPSPNMPSVESALAYPGMCLFEGTPLSVGRGTDRAFEWVGAPWLDGEALAERLNGASIPGVRFEPARFTPRAPGDGKFPDVEVHGVRLVAENPGYDAPRAAVAVLVEAYAMSGDRWSWREAHFDRLAGTDALRRAVEAGATVEAVTADWSAAIADFETRRASSLLYR